MKAEETARRKKITMETRRQAALLKEYQGRIAELEEEVGLLETLRVEMVEKHLALTAETTALKKKVGCEP